MLHEDFGEITNERIYWSIRAMEKNAGVISAQINATRDRGNALKKAARLLRPVTPHQKVQRALQCRLKCALFAQDATRKVRGFGYTIAEAIARIEGLFTEGMNWGNHGEWEIDHIRPCCRFDLTKADEQLACFALSNLQPLWRADNRRKSGRYVE